LIIDYCPLIIVKGFPTVVHPATTLFSEFAQHSAAAIASATSLGSGSSGSASTV
jgi:hypothetical protein